MSGLFANLLGDRGMEGRDWSVYVETMEKNREAAGGIVTPNTAMRFSAVYACVRVLAETMASLPLILYERLDRGKRRAQDHYLYPLLHDEVNELMTAFDFWETITGHVALWGNAYIQVDHDEVGRVKSLWPLLPGNVIEKRRDGNRRFYHYQLPTGRMQWLSSDIIWHLRGLGGNGLDGDSVVGYARKSIKLGLNALEFGNRFYENDARPGIVLEHPAKLSDEAHKRLKRDHKEEFEGVEKSHRVQILEEGMKLHEVGIPPEDAQFLETRKFQVREIARWFRMQPHKIGDLEQATFSNIEHQSIEHVVDPITPWSRRYEQSITKNLLLKRDRKKYYAEFLLDSLLRGDTQSRYQAYAQGRQNGWLSANDIRELENMNPIDGGDIYLVPLNMIPAPSAGGAPRAVREKRSVEDRSATMRSRLRNSYLDIYQDTAARILRREKNDIKKQVKKTLSNRDMIEFLMWLEDYYQNHADFVKRKMATVNNSYGEAVAFEALEEIEQDPEVSPEAQRFIDSYTGGYAARHVGISQDLIRRAITESQQEEMDPDEAILLELEAWDNERAAMIAREESTRFNNALAKTLFVMGGVQKIRSVAFGDSCPYCKALDGVVIGVNEYFISEGEEFQPEGADAPLTSTKNLGHPPYHDGCDCMVTIALLETFGEIELPGEEEPEAEPGLLPEIPSLEI